MRPECETKSVALRLLPIHPNSPTPREPDLLLFALRGFAGYRPLASRPRVSVYARRRPFSSHVPATRDRTLRPHSEGGEAAQIRCKSPRPQAARAIGSAWKDHANRLRILAP